MAAAVQGRKTDLVPGERTAYSLVSPIDMSNTIACVTFLAIAFCCQPVAQKSAVDALAKFAEKRGIDNEESQKYLQRGMKNFLRRDYQKAAEDFGQAALASPKHPLPNLYLGCSLFALKHYSLAGKVMRRVTTLYPDWENLPLNFHKLFPPESDFGNRLSDFEDWAFRESKDANTYFLLGFLCQFSGESRKAEAAYRVTVSCDPFYREAYDFLSMLLDRPVSPLTPYDELRARGQKFLEKRQYLKAVDVWSTACVEYPDRAEALYSLGYSLAALGRFKEGSFALQAAIGKSPGSLKLQMQTQGKHMQQDASCMTALEEHFKDKDQGFDITFLLGYFYALMGENKKARSAWKHASKINPESFELKELEKALSMSIASKTDSKYIKKDEKNSGPVKTEKAKRKSIEGKKYFREQKYQKAAQSFSRQVMDFPDDKEAQWLLGLTTFATGQYSYTYKFFKALLPEASAPIWQNYYAKPKHLEKQMESLAKWLREHPDDNSALFVQGVMLLGTLDKKRAYRVFSTLKKRLPEDPEVEYGYRLAQKLFE